MKSVPDNEVDALTSYNPEEMRYYIWLVQRKLSPNTLTLNLKSLNLPTGTKVFAEEVSADAYGEVVWSKEISENGQLSFELPAQSVMLLTIPACQSTPCTLIATADATIKSGSNSEKNFGKIKR